MNSTLFDDMIVGTETENNDQDRESSLYDAHEDPLERSEEADKPAESDYERRYHHQKNPEEERAGMADESMKVRASSVENDKRSDLMIAHRHYEDIAEASNDRSKEDGSNEDGMRPNERYLEREHGYREPHDRRNGRRHYEKYHRSGAINEYKHRHSKDEAYKNKDGEENHSLRPSEMSERGGVHSDNDENEGSGSGETLGGHFASKYHAPPRQHDSLHANLFHSAKSSRKKGKSRQKASLHSHSHTSSQHKSHSHKSKKSGKQKSVGMNKEEKLIEKLEHLEEKIEKKQKTDIESRNEKILQKVETLANKLEKKTSDGKKEKGKKKGKLDKKNKAKEEEAKNGDGSDKQTIDGKITEMLEGSGEKEGHEKESSPEQIIIPPGIHHHKMSNKKSSKTKHHYVSLSHEEKTHSSESSGESSGNNHLESSGGGEDEDGVIAHYLGHERDHKVEDTNWPSTQLIVPYFEKKSHTGHHSSHRMPILNENILDKLGKDQHEKKDKIAKPSIKDKNKLKSHIKKQTSNTTVVQDATAGSKKSHVEKKHKKKSHSKSKHQTKNSKKATENMKLMKEFEKYRAFIKAQELAISGDGSGEQGSGRVAHVKIKKVYEKKRSKKKKKKKYKGKGNKKGDKHKKAKEEKAKNKNVSIKSSALKHFEELISSGYSQDHGSGEEDTKINGKEEGSKKEKEAAVKQKEKSEEKQHHHTEKSKHVIANKKSGNLVKSKLLGDNSTLNVSGIVSNENDSNGITQQKKINPPIDEGPKPFHDRKETAAGDDNLHQQPNSHKNTAKVPLVKDTKSVPRPKVLEKGRPHGEVISERNTSWPHPRAGSTSHDKASKKQKQLPTLHSSSNGISHKNKTVQVQESSIKRVDTTHRITKTTKRPTTKTTKKLVTTTAPTTTIPTTRKRTTATTVKKKPKKVKPRPTTKMTTTNIPTLSILTGDEDVEPTARPTKHKKQSKITHSDKKTRTKKPAIPKKSPKIDGRKDYVKGNKENSITKPRTTESPIEEEPVATEKPLEFQPSPPVPTIAQHGPVQQQFPGQGGSTGILGDLQLPEPPGNGNRASGPPFYGQQGVPGNLPMQQPFGPMQYRKMPMGNQQNIIGKTPEEIKRPFNPTAKTFPPTQYFGYSPMERPTTLPLIGFHNNGVKPSIAPPKRPQNGAPQSPENVIQRILGAPHKQSPLNVIQRILQPKNTAHKENQGTTKPPPAKHPSQSKANNVKGQNLRGQNTKGQNKGQKVKEQKPNEIKKSPLQNQGSKKPSPTGKKPSTSARNSKKGQKPPLGRLNDFFKNANDAKPLKTTGNFWRSLPSMAYTFCY